MSANRCTMVAVIWTALGVYLIGDSLEKGLFAFAVSQMWIVAAQIIRRLS